jgi:formate C-acetyltransferase
MIMTFVLAARAGKALGASPDGRNAGETIAHGLTPQNASMKHGITTAMASANSLRLEKVWGGTTSMWDIDESYATQENLKSIIKVFLKQGGQIYQGNTTSVDELRRAYREPEKYKYLIVRVGGYSGRFCSLDKELQKEIINRKKHCG